MAEIVHTGSVAETERFGFHLAEQFKKNPKLPPFFALRGDLGAGKTAFVRGFTAAIAPDAAVRSPTFALVREYPALPRPIFHFDLYRIEDEDDLISVGYYDYIRRGGILLVEWSDHIPECLPDSYFEVTLEKDSVRDPDSRKISVRLIDNGTEEEAPL